MSQLPENVRPWGGYEAIESGPGYQVKRIFVSPGKRLSYQSHKQRAEAWTIVAGKAKMTLDDKDWEMSVGDNVVIPIGAKHRIENSGEEQVIFIEVQTGDYLGEDDIERYEDDFGREGTTTPHGDK
jgi:mannose-6-phosphate isomerase-like protein (cupin superfamily)